ncbi:MAG: Hsp33 family molecular chaperone HslO, partial [Oscillibacter sp.]|nr:Hsp33 family molecular chaperone HslO [Oscillibacter sp.]
GAPEDVISRVERGVYALGPVTAALRENPDPAALLQKALPDFQLEILERSPVAYRCDCSRRRMEAALIAMGRVEMRKLLQEQGHAELSCRFCGNVQQFTSDDLQSLLERM